MSSGKSCFVSSELSFRLMLSTYNIVPKVVQVGVESEMITGSIDDSVPDVPTMNDVPSLGPPRVVLSTVVEVEPLRKVTVLVMKETSSDPITSKGYDKSAVCAAPNTQGAQEVTAVPKSALLHSYRPTKPQAMPSGRLQRTNNLPEAIVRELGGCRLSRDEEITKSRDNEDYSTQVLNSCR